MVREGSRDAGHAGDVGAGPWEGAAVPGAAGGRWGGHRDGRRGGGRARARVFVAAGRAAVRAHAADEPWVQLNLTPAEGPRGELYAQLARIAREMLDHGTARNFFFMHKAPGLRVRFQAPGPCPQALHRALLRRFRGTPGLRGEPVRAVYEPEHYLFGGPGSMRYVHALFTLDALAWLDHHAGPPRGDGGATAWRLSLVLLGEVCAGLGIVGWEQRGMWQEVRSAAGRRLRAVDRDDPRMRRAADGILAQWRLPRGAALDTFAGDRAPCYLRHAEAVRAAAERWRTGWFEPVRGVPSAAGQPVKVGPRRAAAYFTVFHWNRGLVSLARQNLITEALAGEGSRHAARA